MNPMLIILSFLGVGILWFLLAFSFLPLGKIVKRIWDDAMNAINKDDEKETKE